MLKKIFFAVVSSVAVYAHAQNVGIGTTTPQSQLHIGDNSANELIIGRNKSAGGFTALYMGTSAVSNGYSYIQSVRSAGSQYGNLVLNPFNGNVGIATNNPLFKLDVRGGNINTDSAYYIGGAPILVSPGNFNLFAGLGAGSSVTTGNRNTAYGTFALYSILAGVQNTAVGSNSLFNMTNGFENTAVGYEALFSSGFSYGNTAVGCKALSSTLGAIFQSSDQNTAIGANSMNLNTDGSDNTAVGANSLENNISGNGNICVGYRSDVSTGNLTNATAIGYDVNVNASNKIRLGNYSVTVFEGNAPYSLASDGRFKTNITETVKGLDFIMKLRPVVYNFQAKKMDEFLSNRPLTDERFAKLDYSGAENMRQSGFIAQEVEQAAITAGYDFNGVLVPKNEKETYSLAYSQFVVPLVKAVQEQQQLIQQLQKEIEALKIKTNSQK